MYINYSEWHSEVTRKQDKYDCWY